MECEGCTEDYEREELEPCGPKNELLCPDCIQARQEEASDHYNRTGDRLNPWGNPTHEDRVWEG